MADDSVAENQSDANGVPLDRRSQTRNIVIYAACAWLFYLIAPVVYVGITHVSLCHELGASDTVANLPSSASFWMSAIPIVVAWRFHTVRAIKPVLAVGYLVSVFAGLMMSAVLWFPVSRELRVATVGLYGALAGASVAVTGVFMWEMLNRGVDVSRRGAAFGLAYGVGPAFAVVGSLGAQVILSGRITLPSLSQSGSVGFHSVAVWNADFPSNFSWVFAASAPIALGAALLVTCFVLPTSQQELSKQPLLANVSSAFRDISGDRRLRTAVLAFLAVSAGAKIMGNMSLFTPEALNQPSEDLAGVQNALRFSFKIVVGLLLGWLLAKTHAKMGMLATGGMTLLGIGWVLLMPRSWFLIAFGFMGAGELYGVYYPNYIVAGSRPEQVRLNMAFVSLLSLPLSLAPVLFGVISDNFGLLASFVAAGGIVAASLALVGSLPSMPKPIGEKSE